MSGLLGHRGLLMGADAGDLYASLTEVLLHFDGTNGSTTFIDSSSHARTMTLTGSATISTAQSKFGGASGRFNGSGARIATPATAWAISGDFSVSGWVRFDSVGSVQFFFGGESTGVTNWLWLELGNNASQKITAYVFGNQIPALANASVNTWYFVEMNRSGSTVRLFIDGVQQGFGTNSLTRAADAYTFGGVTPGFNSNTLVGHMDEWRFVNGAAVNTSNYAPPVAPW